MIKSFFVRIIFGVKSFSTAFCGIGHDIVKCTKKAIPSAPSDQLLHSHPLNFASATVLCHDLLCGFNSLA